MRRFGVVFTRFANSINSILSVQKQKLPRDVQELPKVLGAEK